MATEIIIKEKVFGATRQLLKISVGVCQEKKTHTEISHPVS